MTKKKETVSNPVLPDGFNSIGDIMPEFKEKSAVASYSGPIMLVLDDGTIIPGTCQRWDRDMNGHSLTAKKGDIFFASDSAIMDNVIGWK